jgi:cold shock CspA family protein
VIEDDMDEQCSYGTVATWVLDNGFGFIHPDNSDRAVFVHLNQCWNREPLERGWRRCAT